VLRTEKSKKKTKKVVTLYRTHPIQELSALLFFFLILCLYRAQALKSFSSHYLGGYEHDAGLYIWLVKVNIENFSLWWTLVVDNFVSFIIAGDEKPLNINFWFNSRAFYPYGATLAFSDNFILPSLLMGLLTKLGFSFVQSWNAIILFANVLNGYLTHRLSMRLSGGYLASLLAGVAFMTWSWFGEHLGHPQLQFAFFIPLALLAFFRFIEKPKTNWAFSVGLVLLMAHLSTVYYAVFITLILIVAGIFFSICNPALFKPKNIVRFILGFGSATILFIPFILPYLHVKNAFGARFLYEPFFFAANGLSYLSSPVYNWLYGASTANLTHTEGHLFPTFLLFLSLCTVIYKISKNAKAQLSGLLLILFLLLSGLFSTLVSSNYNFPHSFLLNQVAGATTWLTLLSSISWISLTKSQGSPLTKFFILIFVLFYLISFGPLGNVVMHEPTWGIYTALYYIFPGFDAVRAIARSGIIVTFSLSMILGLFFANLKKLDYLLASLKVSALVIILVENFNVVYPLETASNKPEIFNSLNTTAQVQDSAIVIPFAPGISSKDFKIKNWTLFTKLNVNYMNWAVDSKAKLINGYSGQQTWIMKELPKKLYNFPDERSLTSLSLVANLKYILVLPKYIADFNDEEFNFAIQKQIENIEVVNQDSEGNYLLKLKKITQLKAKEDLTIITEPDRGRKSNFRLQVRAAMAGQELSSTIRVEEPDSNKLLFSQDIQHDGLWHVLEFNPDPTAEQVKPRRFTLRLADNNDTNSKNLTAKVFVREPQFQVY